MQLVHLARKMAQVHGPKLKCCFAFGHKVVPLIHGGNASDRAGRMIQNFVCDVRSYPEPGHPRNGGTPQIVQAPSVNAGSLVELALAPRKRAELLAAGRKDVIARSRASLDDA